MAAKFTRDALTRLREGFHNHSTVLGLIEALEASMEENKVIREHARALELRLFHLIPFGGISWEEFKVIVNMKENT